MQALSLSHVICTMGSLLPHGASFIDLHGVEGLQQWNIWLVGRGYFSFGGTIKLHHKFTMNSKKVLLAGPTWVILGQEVVTTIFSYCWFLPGKERTALCTSNQEENVYWMHLSKPKERP